MRWWPRRSRRRSPPRDQLYDNVRMGEYSYRRPRGLCWLPDEYCSVGKFCSIASGVTLLGGGAHTTRTATSFPLDIKLLGVPLAESRFYESKGPAVVQNDVWIGSDALILSGALVGHGAVIAARTVVARDVPPFAIVAGNPAQVIKYRFSDHQIEALLKIEWWDWSVELIRSHVDRFAGDIDSFIEWALDPG